jgi:hypothetical protein
MTTIENLNILKDLLIPEIFFESRNSFSTIIEKSLNEPEKVIDLSILMNNQFFGVTDYNSENFSTMCLLDSLTEGYIQPFKKFERDSLWDLLSSILNCQNIEFLRPLIDKEIYENTEIRYDFYNSSLIFRSTDFMVVNIHFIEFDALTIIHKNKFVDLENVSKELGIKIWEMNKNVA